MRRLAAAVAFLTRAPLPARLGFGAADVGRGALFFPLVGAALGLTASAALPLRDLGLPSLVVAVLCVALLALATGALHLDGLADTVDGFGGGRTREDVLRIMRDHAVGAYGALALVLVVLLKVAAVAALVDRGQARPYLVVAAALARWSGVALARICPYARPAEGGLGAALTEHVGWVELAGATLLAGAATLLVGWGAVACWAAVLAVTALAAWVCLRRIGGVTGDTLGATTELGEAAILTVGLLA
jgi:cobalamin 5'-phosphate synthase/cobalamin synthase